MAGTMENEIVLNEKDVQEETEGIYVHKLNKPFTWEGETYTELTFNFDGLKGSDLEAAESEMNMEGKYAPVPEYSIAYVMKIAARAAHVHSSVIENLPIKDANVIKNKTKSFLLGKE